MEIWAEKDSILRKYAFTTIGEIPDRKEGENGCIQKRTLKHYHKDEVVSVLKKQDCGQKISPD